MDASQHRESLAGVSASQPVRRALPKRLAVGVAIGLLLSLSACSTWRGARLYHTGTLALERGDVPRALADLEAAAALVPDASQVHNNLGLAQLAAGEQDHARLSFERATELDCDNVSASDNLRSLEARLQRDERRAAIDRVSREQTGRGQTQPGREEAP